MTDTNLRILLDTASTLNARLAIQNQETIKSKTLLKKESAEGKKVILQDIKDATETFNREFLERDKEISSGNKIKNISTIQDYSLIVLFSGFAFFIVLCLIYILQNSKAPIMVSVGFLVLISLVYVFMVFLIQRYG